MERNRSWKDKNPRTVRLYSQHTPLCSPGGAKYNHYGAEMPNRPMRSLSKAQLPGRQQLPAYTELFILQSAMSQPEMLHIPKSQARDEAM